MTDALTVSQDVVPYVTSAVSAYGTAVLTRLEDSAADASVAFGKRVLHRILRRGASERSVEEKAVAVAVQDLAADPDDADLLAFLRVQIKKALLADPHLLEDLADMTKNAGITVTAKGERSVSAHTIHGDVRTGDSNVSHPASDGFNSPPRAT